MNYCGRKCSPRVIRKNSRRLQRRQPNYHILGILRVFSPSTREAYSRANLSMLAAMVRLILPSVLVSAIAVTSTMAMARSRHQNPPETYSPQTNFYHPSSDPNAVYVGGSYAGSDPDPNIQGALIREFGRRGL